MSCGLQDVVELEVAGRPAVLVHSSAFVQAAADQAVLLGQPSLGRVAVLREGRIVSVGAPAELTGGSVETEIH